MPEPTVDIATADNWLGFRPGMSRTQVREQLKQTGSAETRHGDDNFSAKVNGQHVDFWFATDGSERLRQISLEDELCWNGQPIVDLALDDLLKALEPLNQAPMWEANDATDEPFPESDAVPTGAVSDEELIEESTLWLPDRQIGFVIWRGGVMDVVWRTPQDMPAQFAGPVTPAQRQLSLQADPPPDPPEKSEVSESPSEPKGILHWILKKFAPKGGGPDRDRPELR